jgi:hypothetical protein
MAVPHGTAKFREETSKKADNAAEPLCCDAQIRRLGGRLQALFCSAALLAGDGRSMDKKMAVLHSTAKFREETSKKAGNAAEPLCCDAQITRSGRHMQALFCSAALPPGHERSTDKKMAVLHSTAKFREETSKKAGNAAEPLCCDAQITKSSWHAQALFCSAALLPTHDSAEAGQYPPDGRDLLRFPSLSWPHAPPNHDRATAVLPRRTGRAGRHIGIAARAGSARPALPHRDRGGGTGG